MLPGESGDSSVKDKGLKKKLEFKRGIQMRGFPGSSVCIKVDGVQVKILKYG